MLPSLTWSLKLEKLFSGATFYWNLTWKCICHMVVQSSSSRIFCIICFKGFPRWLSGKESDCNAGEVGSGPGWGRSPGEGQATHSSILTWRIPWIQQHGGLQSMRLQRVGHDWAQRCFKTLMKGFSLFPFFFQFYFYHWLFSSFIILLKCLYVFVCVYMCILEIWSCPF